jgi:hypothetical protein
MTIYVLQHDGIISEIIKENWEMMFSLVFDFS